MAALTIANVQQELTTLTPEFAKTLPPGMTADRFARVALTAVQNNPDLLNCNPQSLFNACMKAAQDGLLPDGREGAIIPRKGMATWQPMVQGLVAKAKRRGSVTNLVANIVYDGEPFEVLMGDDDRIVHRRELDKVHKGSEVAVYAIATLKDGTKEREVMTWEEVQAVRKMSTTPNVGPWVTSEGEMARKTAIRRLAKRLPALDDGDDDLRQAIERVDELYPFGKNAPHRQGPVIEHERPAPPGSMREVAQQMTPGDARATLNASIPLKDKPQTFASWFAALETDLAQAQSAAGVAAIKSRDKVQQVLAAADEGKVQADRAAKLQHALDAADERVFQTPEATAPADDGWPSQDEEKAVLGAEAS